MPENTQAIWIIAGLAVLVAVVPLAVLALSAWKADEHRRKWVESQLDRKEKLIAVCSEHNGRVIGVTDQRIIIMQSAGFPSLSGQLETLYKTAEMTITSCREEKKAVIVLGVQGDASTVDATFLTIRGPTGEEEIFTIVHDSYRRWLPGKHPRDRATALRNALTESGVRMEIDAGGIMP